jgi:hypothetical protein
MLSIHLRLGLPSGLFPSGFPTNFLQIFSSTPCSQTPSVYVPPLLSETMFHTRTRMRLQNNIFSIWRNESKETVPEGPSFSMCFLSLWYSLCGGMYNRHKGQCCISRREDSVEIGLREK